MRRAVSASRPISRRIFRGDVWKRARAGRRRWCAEVREETGLEIEVGEPFNAWTMRAPGRRILGVDFVCRWRSGDVRLSHEHESFAWLTLEEVESRGWEAEPVYRKAFELVEA